MHPQLVCWWHKTKNSGWYAKGLHWHPEGPQLSHLGKRKLRGIIPVHINTWWKGAKRTEKDFVQWYPVPGPETMSTNWNIAERQKTLFYCEWLCPGTAAQGKLWSLHPLTFSKTIWTWSWVTGCWWSFLSRVVEPDELKRSLPVSTTLWLCFTKTVKK